MRQPIWRCKVRGCRTYGLGGPDVWLTHYDLVHRRYFNHTGVITEIAFGFTDVEDRRPITEGARA